MSLFFGYHMPNYTYPLVKAVTVEQAPEVLGPYIESGIGGFTLNNTTLPTLEAIARAGELIRILNR